MLYGLAPLLANALLPGNDRVKPRTCHPGIPVDVISHLPWLDLILNWEPVPLQVSVALASSWGSTILVPHPYHFWHISWCWHLSRIRWCSVVSLPLTYCRAPILDWNQRSCRLPGVTMLLDHNSPVLGNILNWGWPSGLRPISVTAGSSEAEQPQIVLPTRKSQAKMENLTRKITENVSCHCYMPLWHSLWANAPWLSLFPAQPCILSVLFMQESAHPLALHHFWPNY